MPHACRPAFWLDLNIVTPSEADRRDEGRSNHGGSLATTEPPPPHRPTLSLSGKTPCSDPLPPPCVSTALSNHGDPSDRCFPDVQRARAMGEGGGGTAWCSSLALPRPVDRWFWLSAAAGAANPLRFCPVSRVQGRGGWGVGAGLRSGNHAQTPPRGGTPGAGPPRPRRGRAPRCPLLQPPDGLSLMATAPHVDWAACIFRLAIITCALLIPAIFRWHRRRVPTPIPRSPGPRPVRGNCSVAPGKPRWLRSAYWFDNAGLSSTAANDTTLHVDRVLDPTPYDTDEGIMSRLRIRLYPGPVACARAVPGRSLFAAKLDPHYKFETNPMHSLHDVIVPIFTALTHARRLRVPVARVVAFHPFPPRTRYLGGLLSAICRHFDVQFAHEPRRAGVTCFETLIVAGYDTTLQLDPCQGYTKPALMAHLRRVVLRFHGLDDVIRGPRRDPGIRVRIFPRHGTSRQLVDVDCLTGCLRRALRPHNVTDVAVISDVAAFGDMVRQYHAADVYLEASGGQAANHLLLPARAAVFSFAPCGYVAPLSWYWMLPYLRTHSYHIYRWCEDDAPGPLGGYHPVTNVSCALLRESVVPRIVAQVLCAPPPPPAPG